MFKGAFQLAAELPWKPGTPDWVSKETMQVLAEGLHGYFQLSQKKLFHILGAMGVRLANYAPIEARLDFLRSVSTLDSSCIVRPLRGEVPRSEVLMKLSDR